MCLLDDGSRPRISKPLAIAAAERERDAQQRDDDADGGVDDLLPILLADDPETA
jgi:hypothetical protein